MVLYQDNLMKGWRFFHINGCQRSIDLLDRPAIPFGTENADHFLKYFSEHLCVVASPMMVEISKLQMFCNKVQFMLFQLRKQ